MSLTLNFSMLQRDDCPFVNYPQCPVDPDDFSVHKLPATEIRVCELLSDKNSKVFRGTWKSPTNNLSDVVIKFSPLEDLSHEAEIYENELRELQGTVVPIFYGLF